LSLPIAVLASGDGSTFEAIATLSQAPYHVALLMSDQPQAFVLRRAQRLGIKTAVLPRQNYPDRSTHEAAMVDCLQDHGVAQVALAGYMRIVGEVFLNAFGQGHTWNTHPSLLPAYPGLDTHRRVLQAGEREHGCTIHVVDSSLDGGPIIAQARLTIEPNEQVAHLEQRVKRLEQRLYPLLLAALAANLLTADAQGLWWQDQFLARPLLFQESDPLFHVPSCCDGDASSLLLQLVQMP
jgi:phosphoribosylglycinamide formyltransferase-1